MVPKLIQKLICDSRETDTKYTFFAQKTLLLITFFPDLRVGRDADTIIANILAIHYLITSKAIFVPTMMFIHSNIVFTPVYICHEGSNIFKMLITFLTFDNFFTILFLAPTTTTV